jgi:hypothetical protein
VHGRPSILSKNAAENDLLERKKLMTTGTILLIILVVLLIGAAPSWPHSRNWGYYPSGGIGLILLIVLILLLLGRI